MRGLCGSWQRGDALPSGCVEGQETPRGPPRCRPRPWPGRRSWEEGGEGKRRRLRWRRKKMPRAMLAHSYINMYGSTSAHLFSFHPFPPTYLPIASPTSAAAKLSASFAPSPVTATTCLAPLPPSLPPSLCNARSKASFSSGLARQNTAPFSSSFASACHPGVSGHTTTKCSSLPPSVPASVPASDPTPPSSTDWYADTEDMGRRVFFPFLAFPPLPEEEGGRDGGREGRMPTWRAMEQAVS